ncbi:hypothetical protein [Neisseria shayeganii]|uniref:Uncharacterized protein n=1 Tax=Neisseria shayeganii TaxID=607712 RepID=A0A7D7SGD8_9NEIS|nr:hypothetical protein [Neisseria shayeganii]QMT40012.1 hypothetical protein H3L94_09155 [Neisseria shayeganii]
METKLCNWCERIGHACVWPVRALNFVAGLLFLRNMVATWQQWRRRQNYRHQRHWQRLDT